MHPIDGRVVLLSIGMSNTTQEFSAFKRLADGDARKSPQIYLSSRTYAGYATTALNPEPQAYDSGFAVRWLVNERLKGKVQGPWIAWGPYLWTNGERGRKDGLVWACADTRPSDGTHPSESGQAKVASLLWKFFSTSSTTKSWFLG